MSTVKRLFVVCCNDYPVIVCENEDRAKQVAGEKNVSKTDSREFFHVEPADADLEFVSVLS